MPLQYNGLKIGDKVLYIPEDQTISGPPVEGAIVELSDHSYNRVFIQLENGRNFAATADCCKLINPPPVKKRTQKHRARPAEVRARLAKKAAQAKPA